MGKKLSSNTLSTQLSTVLSNFICFVFLNSGNSLRNFSTVQNKKSSERKHRQIWRCNMLTSSNNSSLNFSTVIVLLNTDRGGLLGSGFAGYVPLASQNPHPIIVYSVANYRPHLSHFWANVIVISRTEFNASRLLNIKTTAGTIFQPPIFLFLNRGLPEFSYPKNPENLRPHSSNSTKNVTPL